MKYGHFDDERMEYVIDTPRTPVPWCNYLGSQDLFTMISNTAGGHAFYKDSRRRSLNRYRYNNSPLNADGFHIYVKDGEELWNIGWQPCQAELESYSCRHGLGYTIIEGARGGIAARQEMLVPRDSECLLQRISVKNTGSSPKTIKLFPYVEFSMWDDTDVASGFWQGYALGEVEVVGSAIYHKSQYRGHRNYYSVLWASCAIDGFDTDRDAFMGVYGRPARPEAAAAGKCTGSVAQGCSPVGAMELEFYLRPGQEDSFILGLGYVENPQGEKFAYPEIVNKRKANEMMERFETDEQFDDAMEELRQYWRQLLSGFRLESEDEKLNRSVNIWNQYQCVINFMMGVASHSLDSQLGYKELCHDIYGVVHMLPELVRERVLDLARAQSAGGKGYKDYALWLIAVVDAYIRETGDWGVLDETVAFDMGQGQAATLMEHLRRAFNYNSGNLGSHGLPLTWNVNIDNKMVQDSQDEESNEGIVAENVSAAGLFVKCGKAYAEICRHQGLKLEAEACLDAVKTMEQTVLKKGWDGDWFRCAYDTFGKPIGSKLCSKGKIFLEPQGLCVMAEIGKETGQAAQALKSVEQWLDTKYGIMFLQPAYTGYHPNLGEISGHPTGYRENGGICCRNNPWIICAEATMGHGERAFRVYRHTCPIYMENKSEIQSTEPYVYSQLRIGKDSAGFGGARNSWLTGTASWSFLSISHYILGIRPSYEGLTVNPCIPPEWRELHIIRRYRGAEYDIRILNPDGVEHGVRTVIANGHELIGNLLPVATAGTRVTVEVIMGEKL